jgi:hypothetical protein
MYSHFAGSRRQNLLRGARGGRGMYVRKFQAKQPLSGHGVPAPRGAVARTPDH